MGREEQSTDMRPEGAQVTAGIVMVLVQLAFAGWHVLGKVALNQGVSPLFFAFIREGGASLVLLLAALIFDEKPRKPTRRECLIFLLMGFVIFVNIVGFILALELVSPVTAAIYQPLIPVWTAIFAIIFRVEPANPYMLTGIALAVSGAIVASMSDTHENPDHPPEPPRDLLEWSSANDTESGISASKVLGNTMLKTVQYTAKLANSNFLGHIILLVQTFSLGSLYLIQKQVVNEFPSLTITAWYYSIGSIFTVILCFCYFQSFELMYKQTDYLNNTHVVIAVVYAIVVGTAFTYGGSTWANKRIHATIVSLYTVLQSPFTLLLSIMFLGTTPQIKDMLCMVLIIFGMALVVGSKLKEERDVNSTSPLLDTRVARYHPVGREEKRDA